MESERTKSKKRAWLSTGEGFRTLDAFGEKLPTFNIKGSDRVNTIAGGVLSIVLYMTVFMYSMIKLGHLVTKHNPNISTFYKDNEMYGISLNLNERKFRFAFTVESYRQPKEQKNDPRYVKYLVRYYGKRKGKEFQRILPYHKCTEDDYKEFYPVKKESSVFL